MFRWLQCAAAALLILGGATRAGADSVTIAWDANTEPDVTGYIVAYGNAPGSTSATVNVGNVTGWTLSSAIPGQTYYFRVIAYNAAGLQSSPSIEVSATVAMPPVSSTITFSLDRSGLAFGATRSFGVLNTLTPAQTIVVTQTGGTTGLIWSAVASHPWIKLSRTAGTGTGAFTISVQNVSLPTLGSAEGSVVVTGANAVTAPQTIPVRVRIVTAGGSSVPFGAFDSPVDGSTNVVGAIPVTGWALDDVHVAKVEIYRDRLSWEPWQPGGRIYIGDAAFVAGARPDVEAVHATTPMAYRAGWGYLLLTNVLPDIPAGLPSGGNGTFRLHAYAVDAEGYSTYLGAKQFTANNRSATKPFGTLDTPGQGATIAGSGYVSFGWALSPIGTIPVDGSTISVYIDGILMGNATYNNYRADIANAFPGLVNSNGAIGYFVFDTTQLTNGVHTMGWLVYDSNGNGEGLGSRFFTVFNGDTASAQAAVNSSSVATSGAMGSAVGQSTQTLEAVPVDNNVVEIRQAFNGNAAEQVAVPEWSGDVSVAIREMEQVELRLANQFSDGLGGTFEGYLIVGKEMRPLPIGSALDSSAGVFTWQLGPGFVGEYEFVFVRSIGEGLKTKVPVKITVAPKFDRAGDGTVRR